jgi:tRNA 2-thiouridine synthesizing protein A
MSRLSSGEKEFLAHDGAPQPAPSPVAEDLPAEPAAAAPSAEPGIELVDARGISSPLPLLRAHRALRTMRPGQLLKVLTSSGETLAEFQALAKYVVSYELVSQEETGDGFLHVLRRRR